jgi:hypothetical protein
VSIGTRVQAINLANHHPEQLTILGAWDFDAEKHVISYLSPIAQSLLNRKVGEEVEFELDGVTNRYAIAGIESCQTASSVPPGQTATQAIPSTDAAQAADGAAESAPAASPSPAESMGQAQDQIGQAQNPQQDTSRVELAPSA